MESSSSSEDPGVIEIRWANDTEMTSENQNVLPGHQIKLKIYNTTGDSLTQIKWTLPGQTFSKLDIGANQTTGEVKGVTDDTSTTINFHWRDSSDNRTVSVKYIRNGSEETRNATFNVKALTVTTAAAAPDIGVVENLHSGSRNYYDRAA